MLPDDGDTCGLDRICLSGVCRQSFCGDRYVDAAAVPAEQCDPPNLPFCNLDCTLGETCNLAGTWAEKVEVSVSWPAGFADAGTGVIEQWALLVITPVAGSSTEFTGSLVPCGTIIPDFTSTLAMGALFGLEFPNVMWNAPDMPAFAVTGRVGNIVPGSSFEMDPFSLLLGLTMQDPFAPWPTVQSILDGTAAGITVFDHDSNARDGISVLSKDDPEYTLPPVDLTNLSAIPQADILDLALRQITAASGTLTTCDSVSGQVSITRVDTHVVGCRVGQMQGVPVTPRECTDTEVVTVNDGSPKYTATSATFVAQRVSDTATCADVRALFPAIVR
jgi:hypothetical protein